MSNQNFYPAFKLSSTDPYSRYHGTTIVFENPVSKEVFEGIVESNRSESQLYVRIPELNNSTQRVMIDDILAVTKHVDNSKVTLPSFHNKPHSSTKTSEVNAMMEVAMKEFYKNARKEFLFLPDGKPVSSLLNKAKKESKKDKKLKHSDVLNSECLERFNINYNKLMPKAKRHSPFMVMGKLFLPFNFKPEETGFDTDVILYVSIGKESVTVGEDIHICQPKDFFFKGESLALSDIEMLFPNNFDKSASKNYGDRGQGWCIEPYVTASDSPTPYLIVNKSHEGIVVDLWVKDESGEDQCIESTYEFTSELVMAHDVFDKLKGMDISAIDACCKMGITEELYGLDLFIMNGLEMQLFSNELDSPDHPARFEALAQDGGSHLISKELSSNLDDISFEIALSLAS